MYFGFYPQPKYCTAQKSANEGKWFGELLCVDNGLIINA